LNSAVCSTDEESDDKERDVTGEGEPTEEQPPDKTPTQKAPVEESGKGEMTKDSAEKPRNDDVSDEAKSKEEEIEGQNSKLSPPVIEMTPQQRRDMRSAKEEAREAERKRIAEEEEEAWKEIASQAVLVIQIAERARQGRYKFAAAVDGPSLKPQKSTRESVTKKAAIEEKKTDAALTIQRAWKTHRCRQKVTSSSMQHYHFSLCVCVCVCTGN
jgi:hypothetical protein